MGAAHGGLCERVFWGLGAHWGSVLIWEKVQNSSLHLLSPQNAPPPV